MRMVSSLSAYRVPRVAVAALAFALYGPPALAAAPCADCDGDGIVAINELITGIGIALGETPVSQCTSLDRDGDGRVGIAELVAALNDALYGCDAAATATPTPTPNAAPTATPDAQVPPTTPQALLPWLQAGPYRGWAGESGVHPSAGPHGGAVRTFLNDALFDSLSVGAPSHPAGSAAVKELYGTGSTVIGWAVMVKLQADSDGGRGWYWYEFFGSGFPYSGVGLPICTGCHVADSRDFVKIPFPLQ